MYWEPPKYDGKIWLKFYHSVEEDVISERIFKTNVFTPSLHRHDILIIDDDVLLLISFVHGLYNAFELIKTKS